MLPSIVESVSPGSGIGNINMSVAFTREESAETAAEVELPERVISPHPNFVTAAGLDLLKTAMATAAVAVAAAQTIEDINERRRAAAPAARDLRYYTARVASAQVKAPPAKADVVGFGHEVTFERDDGRRQVFRIVGEDEADPSRGSISYVSPVARALMGKSVGDTVTANGQEIDHGDQIEAAACKTFKNLLSISIQLHGAF